MMFLYFKALRVHHWSKNLLIFLPSFMGHRLFDLEVFLSALLAFFAFSLCASAGYLFNDIIDYKSDINNPYKSKRPLASGLLTKKTYFSLSIILLSLASFLSSFISIKFAVLLLSYFAFSLIYSYVFKSILILDVLILAGFYAFRVFAGSIATNILVSEWLLSFCMFFFLSLALGKRASELISLEQEQSDNGRAYQKSDLNIISQLGVCSGLISVLVLAFYVNSEHVSQLYTNSRYLWGFCLILVYWISRFWVLISQGKVEQDPVVFALNDKASYISASIIVLIVIFAA